MTLAVAEALKPNKPNQTLITTVLQGGKCTVRKDEIFQMFLFLPPTPKSPLRGTPPPSRLGPPNT